jgi:excisionase family DNA binding protein
MSDPLDGWDRLVWVTTKQAAAYLQVSPRTVTRYVQDGRIRPYRVASRAGGVRFRRVDVESLVDGDGVVEEKAGDR